MKLGRRSFLKGIVGLGAAAVAAPLVKPATALATPVVAPLFVPAQNLDMGVPRRILTATELPTAYFLDGGAGLRQTTELSWRNVFLDAEELAATVTIPMLLLQDNYSKEWGGRLGAGSEITVDRETAERWLDHGVAAAGLKAPADLQVRSAQKAAERQARAEKRRLEEAYWAAEVTWADGDDETAYAWTPSESKLRPLHPEIDLSTLSGPEASAAFMKVLRGGY